MTKRIRGQKASEAKSNIIRTSGEIFPDGAVLELLAAASGDRLDLLLWNHDKKIIAPQVEHLGCVYQPLELNETLRRAIRFPSDVGEYGTDPQLFTSIADLFQRFLGLPESEAALLTIWSLSTWFSDCVPSPTALVISGHDMDRAVALLRLLSCVCRRSLVLGDINRSAFFSLMSAHPTLLINQPGLSPKVRDLWRTSNYRGVYLFGNREKLFDVAGSKAIFSGMENGWAGPAIHHSVLPTAIVLPSLGDDQLAEIAMRFQPQLLKYRLLNFRNVQNSRAAGLPVDFPQTETVRNVVACLPGESEIALAAAPLFQSQQQDALARRSCDPNLAILEALWGPLHETKEITVRRLTELTNALLRCRGERVEYIEEEIGRKSKNLGLYRHRNGSGMVFRFSRENCLRIHELVRRFALSLPAIDGCADCRPQVIAPK